MQGNHDLEQASKIIGSDNRDNDTEKLKLNFFKTTSFRKVRFLVPFYDLWAVEI